MSLYIVRSGESSWEARGRKCGRADVPLSSDGRNQAHRAKEALASVSFDVIICSPLDRASETACIINRDKNAPITFDPRIIERDYGDFEGKKEPVGFWDEESAFPSENISEFFARIDNFLDKTETKYKDKNILLVTHGGVALAAAKRFNSDELLGHGEIAKYEFGG